MAFITRLTRDPSELDAISRFRFQIYYGELGSQLPDTVVGTGRLRDELDDVAYQYATFDDGQVVGCVRVVDLQDIEKDQTLIAKYKAKDAIKECGREAIGFTGRMAVAERCRKSSLVHRLMTIATDEARRRGIRVAFLDCSPHLLPFYEAYGFRRYAPAFSDPVFGFKIPLIFLLRDQVGLKQVQSPLARTIQYDDDPEIRAWYTRHYGAYASSRTAALLPCGAFTDLVESFLGGKLTDLLLLSKFSRQEVDLLLKKSTVVRAERGNRVTQSGLWDEYMVVVLSGRLESHHSGHHIDTFVRGDVCGDAEFLTKRERIAEIVALEPSELLVLPTEYLAQLIEKDVVIARTLMRNLAVGMANRSIARLHVMRTFFSRPETIGSEVAVAHGGV